MAGVQGVKSASYVESAAKKRKKELRLYKNIPVWICEYHQEVLPYIYRAIGSKHLPFSGITLLHFDSHPDLMAPLDMEAEKVYDTEILFDVVSIADWILPAVYVGHIKKVIWIKPLWSEQISDKTLCFNVGKHKDEGTIRVSCCEKYFCEDGLFVPREELENCQELTVVVKTMPIDTSCNTTCSDSCNKIDGQKMDFQNGKKLPICNCNSIECKESKAASACLCFDQVQLESEKVVETLFSKSQAQDENLCSSQGDDYLIVRGKCACCGKTKSRSDIDLFMNDVQSQLEEPYILDIDMDFFSTLNPFKTMFSKDEFETLKRFYKFPQHDSCGEHDMIDASEKHKSNVRRLEKTLKFLQENETPDMEKQPPSAELKFMEFIQRWRDLRREPVDYEMIHSAGMTTTLPVHITDEPDIVKMMKTLKKLLSSIPKPTVVTVARSSVDDYTPPKSVDFIQSCLITCLENCYKEDIEFFHQYKEER